MNIHIFGKAIVSPARHIYQYKRLRSSSTRFRHLHQNHKDINKFDDYLSTGNIDINKIEGKEPINGHCS